MEARVAKLLRDAGTVYLFSGAGASADAGIPTFRGSGRALWAWGGGLLLPLFGTPFGWRWLPWLAWPSYRRWFAPGILAAAPTALHRLAAALPARGVQVRVVTQNVDGLEEAAGVPAAHVAMLHGTARRVVCGGCAATLWAEGRGDLADVGACETCGGWPRPDATLFGEELPEEALDRAGRFVGRARADDVLLIVGLSGVVPTSNPFIAAACQRIPRERRVQVNPGPTPYDESCGLNVHAAAGPFFEAVAASLA